MIISIFVFLLRVYVVAGLQQKIFSIIGKKKICKSRGWLKWIPESDNVAGYV